jgi:hypothetical protein
MCAFLSGKKDQDIYVKTFGQSNGGKVAFTRNFVYSQSVSRHSPPVLRKKKLLPSYDTIAFAGLLRGNAHLLHDALENRMDFYYIDHAYFNPGYRFPNWMRVIKNGFVQNTIIPDVDTSRLKNFGIQFKDYDFNKKRNIVVFPPSNTVARVFNQEDWETKTIEKIREYTDRPIVVRKKKGPVMDNLLIHSKYEEKFDYEETLDEVLNNAYCVVAFNSAVSLTALEKGIPVICERYCAAFPLSHSFNEIETLQEKERLPLFASLAWGQFTMAEIKDRATFEYINNTTQWKGKMK